MSAELDVSDAMEMIRESAAGIADRRDLSRIRALRYTDTGFDQEVWREICEMGWPALHLAEEEGGIGLGMAACCALMSELGAALTPEPLIGAMLALRVCGEEERAATLSGEKLVLSAWQEAPRSLHVGTTTKCNGGKLTGTKQLVPMAASADAFVIATSTGWYLIGKDASGLLLETVSTQDGGHYGKLQLENVPAKLVSTVDPVAPLAEATLATAGYLQGLIGETFDRTLDYLRTRVQFGKPIGSFQALQHRMVDLKLELALTGASIAEAARIWDANPGADEGLAAISRAKARASDTAMQVTREAIQLHGGIGYTDEHDIGLYLRKAMVIAPAYGDAKLHRRRFAELEPDMREEAQ